MTNEALLATLVREMIENQARLALYAAMQHPPERPWPAPLANVGKSLLWMAKALDQESVADFPPDLASYLHTSGLRIADLLGPGPD